MFRSVSRLVYVCLTFLAPAASAATPAATLAELNAQNFASDGFTFSGFDDPAATAGPGGITLATSDAFGGLGLVFGRGNISPFATDAAVLEVELTVGAGTLDDRFVVTLTDDDGPGLRDNHQYDVLLNDLPRGTPQTITFALADASRVLADGGPGGDGQPNFGLFGIGVQNNFVNPRGLDLVLHRVSVVAVPEPGVAALLLTAGAWLARRRRGGQG